MRNAQNQANSAYNTAANTGAELGGDANAISSSVTPYLTSEMLHPEGLGQAGIAAETGAALGGAGGADAGIVGQANQRAAVSRNAGGFQAAFDDASRNRMKAAADASEGIESQNENLKQQQQQEGARGLEGLYSTDTSGMLKAESLEPEDINSEVNAGNSGWLQDTMGILGDLNTSGLKGFSFGKGKGN